MDAELIAEHAEGIIATTGCPAGEVQTRLRLGQHREALEAAAKWREIFGPDNYFLELMDHGLSIERRVRDGLLRIGRELSTSAAGHQRLHYVTRDAAHNHEALLCVQTGKTLSDPNRFKFDGDGYYLKSPAARCARSGTTRMAGGCDSTLLIAERVQYVEVRPRDRMPMFPVPEGETRRAGCATRWTPGWTAGSRTGYDGCAARPAEYEIDVIETMGFCSYFLIVADLIIWAKRNGIRVGPGRGSAAGSIVPTRSASPTSTRSRTACCSSGSSIPSAPRCPTSTSTSTTAGAAT